MYGSIIRPCKIALTKAEEIDRIKQVCFAKPVIACYANNLCIRLKVLGDVVFKLV
jgi:hypothetical protein